MLDKIEADGLHHWGQRKEMVTRRRRDDDADDVALFLGIPAAGEEQVDELGRTRRDDIGAYANVRKYRREARALRRQNRARPPPPYESDDGYSTDSSLAPADADDYAAAQQALRDRAAGLDADVKAEEFIHPERGIGKRFAEWREREPEEYEAAFGGLGCVQGWEYWARKEMVGWEPSRVGFQVTERFAADASTVESFRGFIRMVPLPSCIFTSAPAPSSRRDGHVRR